MRKTRARRTPRATKVETVSHQSEEETEPQKATMFERLFSPASADTSVSSRSDDDDDSNVSTLSASSDGTGSSSGSSSHGQHQFDKDLRVKHRNACKNMTNGKYTRAIKIFESILADLLDRFGEEHCRVGAALHNVAVANLRAGHLGDARDAIEEAVRIRKLTLGDGNSKVADSLVEYGIILLSMKNYEESLAVFKEALQHREREPKRNRSTDNTQDAQLKMAKIRHNIGCVNFELGNLEEADKAYKEAIQQQKSAFSSWASPFNIMTDVTKPGYLTMASTMCNKGYIDLERGRFNDAVAIFYESLKIQKVLLEANNKLILSTLDNIGYAYHMTGDYEKASKIYKELVTLQSETYGDQAQKGWSLAVKKLVYCTIKMYQFDEAFENLRLLEEFYSTRGSKAKTAAEDLEKTNELMGDVNYQLFKFPSLADLTRGCGFFADDKDNIPVDEWAPTKPANGSKMSGHRMTYA
eukprot:Nitzschia sp. Nitz4//scaffold149_size55946//37788//39427//NITZ4_006600-RA/size55946-augustus-gene-0.72-mRNA-1//-1//CDS//3329536827//1517//frame0